MSKPSIQNITVTQTFQNWFDKTNEMVDLFRDQVVTASVSGDTTTGDATLLGDFTANTVVAYNNLDVATVNAVTPGSTIQYTSPIRITGTSSPIVATFNFPSGGARTRYTDGVISWDVGMENSAEGKFFLNTGTSTPTLKLSPQGILEVPIIQASENVSVGGDLAVTGTIFGTISANTISSSGGITGNVTGNLIGDVFAPNGTTKVLENGNGTTIPATFTGNVNGTVSSLTNHKTDNLTEGSINLYFTTSRARASVSAGTGVSYNSGTGVISIGQAVATTSDVTFKTVKATGDITAFSSVSDIRQKENIKSINNALDKVSKLGGYTFNYKHDKDTPMTGVIAQELLEVLPEAVYETTDPNTGEHIYAVRHGNVIGLLIEAIKELNEKVGK